MNRQHAYELALRALEECEALPREVLRSRSGSTERSTVSSPDGQTYFLEVDVQELRNGEGLKLTARVDLGSSFKLERIEECKILSSG